MSPHSLLPLVAFFLNVTLAGLSLLRNPGSRLNRVFAYFASAMALWNIGSFMLRTSPSRGTQRASSVKIRSTGSSVTRRAMGVFPPDALVGAGWRRQARGQRVVGSVVAT